MQTSWSNALALAPFVLGVVACSGSETPADAGVAADASDTMVMDATVQPDAGQPPRDAGMAPRDAGEMDAGEAPHDAGMAPRDGGEAPRDAGQMNCTYPAGAVEPMALNEVITSYSWATAYDMANTAAAIDLDLTQVHCSTDDDIDWSPFDVLLFISVPAW